MKKTLSIFLCAAALTGCQSPAKITSKPVPASILVSNTAERFTKSTSTVTVRAYEENSAGERVELVGAACDLRSDELAASIVTPQEVIVPDFKQRKELDNRGVPSALVVTCSKDGKRGVTQVTAQAKELATAYNAGLAAAVLTTLASAAINSGTPWVYQPAVGVLIK